MSSPEHNSPASDRAFLLIRLMVGAVFLSEGCQKFLFAAQLGAGRFAKIGLPYPEVLAPVVGAVEILFGAAVILGLRTRVTVVPLLVVISGAILTTKWPMLLHQGFWTAAHEARTDVCMLLGGIFLLVRGGGAWSLDRAFSRHDAGDR